MSEYIAILDTETTHPEQHVFDIAVLIGDKKGNVVFQRQWIIKEKIKQKLFYEEKRSLYLKRLRSSKYPAKFCKISVCLSEMERIFQQFEITEVYAYNMSFDSRVIGNIANEYQLKNPLIGREMECLWFWSCQTIFQQKSFPKFCVDNPLTAMTEKGNYKTSAENCYSYITNTPGFVEEHTALEDCKIEYDIYLHCLKQKKYRCKGIAHNVWLLVQSEEQIEKLPPQFRTMQVSLQSQVERAGELINRFKKPLKVEIEIEGV